MLKCLSATCMHSPMRSPHRSLRTRNTGSPVRWESFAPQNGMCSGRCRRKPLQPSTQKHRFRFRGFFGGKIQKPENYPTISMIYGGEGGIRTHGRLAPTTVFETATIDHSVTSPRLEVVYEGDVAGDSLACKPDSEASVRKTCLFASAGSLDDAPQTVARLGAWVYASATNGVFAWHSCRRALAML
jgi:hypothetical protein